MSTADLTQASVDLRRAPHPAALAGLHLLASLLLVGLSVAAFVISTPFGVAVTFFLTLGLAIVLPASIPIAVVASFLFQNLVIAWFTPMVPDDEAFDSLRGANFVLLMAAYGAFLVASFQVRLRALTELRPWLLAGFGLLAVICFYLALGMVNGEPRDAIIYFRNTVSPLACFHIALVASSLYRVDLDRALLWMAVIAIAYGYAELLFTLDFLSFFNGDLYIERQIRRQIDTGFWEKTLEQTGFVLRGLEDVMTTSFFNTPFFKGIFPDVFRIGGPNFHPISFAYALAILAVSQVLRGRWLLFLAALPLLLVIGSKGAMAMLLFAVMTKLAMKIVPMGVALALFVGLCAVWILAAVVIGAANGDYHVLGFFAGMSAFLSNPLGVGLGLGGNLSSSSENLNWEMAQATGATDIPVESAIGVMLYQMGVGGFVFLGLLLALALTCRRLFLRSGDGRFLFGFVGIIAITANAVLQEEAFFSPLALGLCLVLVGTSLGTHWRESRPTAL